MPFHSTLYNNENLLRKNTSKTKRKLIAYFHNARATTRVAHINVKPLSYILAAKRNAIFFTRSQKELIHSPIRNFVFDIPQCGVSANPRVRYSISRQLFPLCAPFLHSHLQQYAQKDCTCFEFSLFVLCSQELLQQLQLFVR